MTAAPAASEEVEDSSSEDGTPDEGAYFEGDEGMESQEEDGEFEEFSSET